MLSRHIRGPLIVGLLLVTKTTLAQPAPIPGFVVCDVPLLATAPSAVTSSDFNRDGNADLAAVDRPNGRVVILLTNPDRFAMGDCLGATVTDAVAVSATPAALAAGDLDLNLNPDIVVAAQAGAQDRKSTRLNSSHSRASRMPSSA